MEQQTKHDRLPNPTHDALTEEVQALIARLQECYGAHAVFVGYRSNEPGLKRGGGRIYAGDAFSAYGIAKEFVLETESRWSGTMREEEEEDD